MKLLEEAPSAPAPRPSSRRVLATMSITLFLVVSATFLGYAMLTASGDDGDEGARVDLTTWAEEVSTTCQQVAEEHSVLTKGADARLNADNVAAVSAGVGALVSGLGDLPQLSSSDEQSQVDGVVGRGAPARTAWQDLETADEASDDALVEASQLTGNLITGLVDLGADCSVLN